MRLFVSFIAFGMGLFLSLDPNSTTCGTSFDCAGVSINTAEASPKKGLDAIKKGKLTGAFKKAASGKKIIKTKKKTDAGDPPPNAALMPPKPTIKFNP